MARIKNIVFILLLIFLFVEVLIIFPKHLEQPEQETDTVAQAEEDLSAEQKIQGVHWVEGKKGNRDWELFSEVAEEHKTKGAWQLQKVKVQFYNNDEIDFMVTGNSGAFNSQSKDMKITGDVIIRSTNGYIFESKEVIYDPEKRRIVSESNITMKGPRDEQGEGLFVQGNSMNILVDQNKMFVNENVRARKDLNESKKFKLTSESAEFSGKDREAKFLGNVIIHYDQMKIEGPTATLAYSQTKDVLKDIILDGGIRVSDEEKYAVSDTMKLNLLANRFVFTGKPRVYQNNDELSGEQIIFLDGGKKVRVENVRARGESRK